PRRRRGHRQLPRDASAALPGTLNAIFERNTMSETNLTNPKTCTTAAVLARPPYRGQLLIDGRWVDAADGGTLERKSPAHDTLVAVYAKAGVVDAERAIAAAREAFDRGPWPQMKGAERARILRNVAKASWRARK